MTNIERHLAEVLFGPIDEWDGDFPTMHSALAGNCAEALLADPTLAAIIDHAARFDWLGDVENPAEAEWRALLADWRAER